MALPTHPTQAAEPWGAHLGPLASGLLLPWAFPGSGLQALAFVALVPFLVALFQAEGLRAKLSRCAAFALAFHFALMPWLLAMHPLMWLGFSWWGSVGVVAFAWVAVSLTLSAQFLALGLVYGLATRRAEAGEAWPLLVLAAGWTALEWLQSWGIFGFTWTNLALTQVPWLPAIQGLEWVGPYPLAALLVWANGALALLWLKGWAWRPAQVVLAVALLLWGGWLGFGQWRLAQLEAAWREAPKRSVGLVQGNIHGGEKFDLSPQGLARSTQAHLALSDRLATASLVVWPETAIPTFLRKAPALQALLAEQARKQRAYLFVGTQDWTGSEAAGDLAFQNSVALIRPEGQLVGMDAKRHLVPYGEFVPWRAWTPEFLARINNLPYDFTAGAGVRVFDSPLGRLGAGVCYDGIFPEAMRPPVLAGAELLVLATNDAWYGRSSAPWVLSAHAQLRAVEFRRCIVRAANTGTSSLIEPTGRVQARTGLFEATALSGQVVARSGLTPYAAQGDRLPQVLAAFLLLALLWGGPRRRVLGS